MNYRVKTNFDRGYVNAMDKVRVFIESNQKVMFVNTDEYKDAKNARAAYAGHGAGGSSASACGKEPVNAKNTVSLMEEISKLTNKGD